MADERRGETPGGEGAAFARYEQTFPTLSPAEVDRLRPFGRVRRYADGEPLFLVGEHGRGMHVILSGHVAITQRDGLGHRHPVVEEGAGQFLAEVGSLSGQPSLVDGHAEGEVEAILIEPEALRRLIVAEAVLGEKIMRALILRRVRLIESHAGGPVLVGRPSSPGVMRLQNFLARNSQPHTVLDPDADAEAKDLLLRDMPGMDELPLVVAPDGTILRNPDEEALARALELNGTLDGDRLYDVAVVGAGPAGLATAVYAASEGLSVVVVDARAFGGQAGASARIENYFGFPTGISGQALAGRAFVQAQKFGAEMMIPAHVQSLDCTRPDGALALQLAGGRLRSRALVIASGARYRRPEIENLERFEGRGVWYWASPIEARLCAGEDVVLVGGGNSAGQAAVYLAGQGARVLMMVRGEGLAATMSRYLIDRIEATPQITVMTRTRLLGLDGAGERLEQVRWRDDRTGEEIRRPLANVFLFVGADPATAWLQGCGVELDPGGFVLTGGRRPGGCFSSDSTALETTVRGVYAVGDVRAGSVKRVGAAIGEGAQVVQALHGYLAAQADA